jgi:N-acetylglucosaminylphosphatidylinositol deacetylase
MSAVLVSAVLAALLALALPAVYSYLAASGPASLPLLLRNKRICLLIAHPDDEAMFFAPTVLALTRPETGNHVKILCLSTGNADGLGETRKKELKKSGMALGLRDEDDVFVVDRPQDFPDSMTTTWDDKKIANLLCSAFAPHHLAVSPTTSPKGASSANPDDSGNNLGVNIDVLITFDRHGVSSHPNHISLYHGARIFVAGLLAKVNASAASPTSAATTTNSHPSPVALYTLSSVNILRKYSSILDAFTTLASNYIAPAEASSPSSPAEGTRQPAALVFMSALYGGEANLATAWHAMTTAHVSQMVWFRYLWIGFSRYMLINDLRLEDVRSEASES